MSGVFCCWSQLTAPWGLEFPGLDHSMLFHVVTEGRCWLQGDGVKTCRLEPGMVSLILHGNGHRLVSEPGAVPVGLFEASRERVSPRYEVLRHGGGGAPTSMLCGLVRFDHSSMGH